MSESEKGHIHVKSRPSTLEEDEWAVKWACKVHERNAKTDLVGASLILGALAVVAVVASYAFLGNAWAGGFGLFSIFLFMYIIARFFIRRSQRPSLHQGKPIGEVVTVAISVQKAWEIFDGSKKSSVGSLGHWIMRIAPGVHVFTMLGQYQTPSPQSVQGFEPGKKVELDMYCYPPSGGGWQRSSSLFLTVRTFEPIEYERLGRAEANVFPLGMYWLDHAAIEQEAESGGSSSENSRELPLVFVNHVESCLDRLIMDMQNSIYSDICTVVDEREQRDLDTQGALASGG